ncbi:MAG: hypothetical protein AB7G06_04695 [Bdellovibrionales bacterium]
MKRAFFLKKNTANDNSRPISAHLLEQLSDIIAFIADRQHVGADTITTELSITFGIGSVTGLRDDQFRPALDYVLKYKAGNAA